MQFAHNSSVTILNASPLNSIKNTANRQKSNKQTYKLTECYCTGWYSAWLGHLV